jgi:hypothetical protein
MGYFLINLTAAIWIKSQRRTILNGSFAIAKFRVQIVEFNNYKRSLYDENR